MSTKRLQSALAFFFTSAAIALVVVACDATSAEIPGRSAATAQESVKEAAIGAVDGLAPQQLPSSSQAIELELALASRRELYLELDLGHRILKIKARGIAVDQVDLADVRLLAVEQAERIAPDLNPPVVWRVAARPAGLRPVSAPATLRAFADAESTQIDRGTASVAAVRAPPAETPDRYSVPLESGWLLELAPEGPPPLPARLAASARDGWERLRGRHHPLPPRILLRTSVADARRIHHLFRKGTAILVRSPAPS